MSWRMHLAIVDPTKIANVRILPKEHYLNDEGYTCDDDGENSTTEFYEFVDKDFGCKEDYCLGDLDIDMDNMGEPFYKNPETQELFEHYHPRIINHNAFKMIIHTMGRAAYDLYKEAEEGGQDQWRALIHRRKQVWAAEYVDPYNLRENSKEIVNAFNIDYQIWDVVRMYKTIDWEKDAVILFGW